MLFIEMQLFIVLQPDWPGMFKGKGRTCFYDDSMVKIYGCPSHVFVMK
jgi:hypothetical protein